MSYVTIEDRVERLEALFGQFITDMAVMNKRAEAREAAAEQRNIIAEQRHAAAEQRNAAAEERMTQFRQELAESRREWKARADQFSWDLAENSKKADERMALFSQDMAGFKIEVQGWKRELNKRWGDLANKMGTIIEDIMAPNLRRLAREHFRVDPVLDFMIRRSRRHPTQAGRETEFDTIVVGDNAVILGEAKSTALPINADEYALKVKDFFGYFPEYQGKTLIPVLSSWAIPQSVIERLTALGIYAMTMGEDTMELVNAAALEQNTSP